MSSRSRVVVAVLAAFAAAVPLTAQQGRSLLVGLYGGGYNHTSDLNAAGTARFMAGYSFGATGGVQLNRYMALHGDFTFHGCDVQGSAPFSGRNFDLFFYGAHLELGYPLAGGFTPYAFLGGGAVTIRELGGNATIRPFTKPAAMFGTGFFVPISGSRLALFVEAKGLAYKWDRGSVSPMQWVFQTTEGRSYYAVPMGGSSFERMQWDITSAAGLSYRFAW